MSGINKAFQSPQVAALNLSHGEKMALQSRVNSSGVQDNPVQDIVAFLVQSTPGMRRSQTSVADMSKTFGPSVEIPRQVVTAASSDGKNFQVSLVNGRVVILEGSTNVVVPFRVQQ